MQPIRLQGVYLWGLRRRSAKARGNCTTKLEMRGKAQRDSPVLELLAPPGEYDRKIRQLLVRNTGMISTPKSFVDI